MNLFLYFLIAHFTLNGGIFELFELLKFLNLYLLFVILYLKLILNGFFLYGLVFTKAISDF